MSHRDQAGVSPVANLLWRTGTGTSLCFSELWEAKSTQLFSAPQLGTLDPVGRPGVSVLLGCSFSAISAELSPPSQNLTQ